MQRKYDKTVLDGMYLFRDDFKSLDKGEAPCLRFNDGKFIGFQAFNKDSIDAYELKKHGIAVKGEKSAFPDYHVDFDALLLKMKDNLNTYWLRWAHACKRFPSIRYLSLIVSLKAVEWGVLGVTRQYYTFRERDITSKIGAGEYALRTVPVKWHKIIRESMRLRKRGGKSFYHSPLARRNDAVSYIDYIITESNKLFSKEKSVGIPFVN